MNIIELAIPGCFLIAPVLRTDDRGYLEKTFDRKRFDEYGMNTDIHESFHTVSKRGVIRGMHFQLPPHDCAKYVSVSHGAIRDVILDLRNGSPTYGKSIEVDLTRDNRQIIYIPSGCAHGFLSLKDGTQTQYLQTAAFAPDYDSGISFDSFDHEWTNESPILSAKDRGLLPLSLFDSPFKF